MSKQTMLICRRINQFERLTNHNANTYEQLLDKLFLDA